jgi:hypothetical protein
VTAWIPAAVVIVLSECTSTCIGGGRVFAADKRAETRASRGDEPFDYFTNSWTVIGLKDHPNGTRVSPAFELLLADGLVCCPLLGESRPPLDWRCTKTLREGYLPIVRCRTLLNGTIAYTLEALACPLDPDDRAAYDWPARDNFLNLFRIAATNTSDQPGEAHVGLAWQAESGSPICQLRDGPAAGSVVVMSGQSLLALLKLPARADARIEADCAQVALKLAAHGTQMVTAVIPFRSLAEPAAGTPKSLADLDFEVCAARTASFWNELLAQGLALEIPEKKPLDTYKASLVYQFIGRDKGEIHPGEGFYDELYLRDGAYQAISLAHAGYLDAARQSLEPFLRFQREDGQFCTQAGQLDANGYAIWGLVEYYRLSGDREWLQRVYPQIQKSVEWIRQARQAEKDPGSPFFGVLPAAPADGEFLWDGKHHIVGYDWWNLRAIQCAALAAQALNRDADAAEYRREFEDYRACVLKALARTGLPYIPPSYEQAGTHWGNLEVVFPSPLLDPRDPRLTATLRFVREEFGAVGGEDRGFIEGVIQWSPGVHRPAAIHPYMSQFVTNSHIIRGEYDEAIDGFYSFLLHTTSTQGFPEGVHFKMRQAWGDTVPHLWAAGLYVTTLRNMFVREEGKTLHLLSCVPSHWLDAGERIHVGRAPTHFGVVGLTATAERDLIRIQVDPPTRRPAERIVVHMPAGIEIEAASRDEKPIQIENPREVVLRGALARDPGPVTLRVRRATGAAPMTFRSRVAAYQAKLSSRLTPIPDLAPPDAIVAIDAQSCLSIDLRRFANTDPLAAPFNVPNPGRFRFAGLSLGTQKVLGVPFDIIDPGENQGRGLIVLRGAHACAGFPREVDVPVRAAARFLCILGNVTGWEPDDPGVGEHGAVGEYQVRYADGSVQEIPLISGRTVDDWAQPPCATHVICGLRGSPWHLNLLVIRLRPEQVESVVFRDFGTPASPVVAAMTLIR